MRTRARGCAPVTADHDHTLAGLPSGASYVKVPDMVGALNARGARPVRLPRLTGAPRAEITRLVEESTIAILPDWSGSIFATWAGDPRDALGAAGESLLQLQRRSGGGRALVLPWGSSPSARRAVGPVKVTKRYRELRAALRNRENLGGNDLPAALENAADRLAAERRKVAVFVPTDGGEPVTQAMHDAVARFPRGAVHLILIDPSGQCTDAMAADWSSVAFGSFTRVQDVSVAAIARQMAEVYAAGIGLSLRPDPSTSPEGDQT